LYAVRATAGKDVPGSHEVARTAKRPEHPYSALRVGGLAQKDTLPYDYRISPEHQVALL
jgi:hypothetical protein